MATQIENRLVFVNTTQCRAVMSNTTDTWVAIYTARNITQVMIRVGNLVDWSFSFQPNSWLSKLRYRLQYLDPRPCYAHFEGRDCDMAWFSNVYSFPCKWLAFRQMERNCKYWEEGPCGWRFITKKQYQDAINEQ